MYYDLREIDWQNRMKKDIENFVHSFLNCQQVKAEHQGLGGLTQVLISLLGSEKMSTWTSWYVCISPLGNMSPYVLFWIG